MSFNSGSICFAYFLALSSTCVAQSNIVANGGFENLVSAHVLESATLEEGCGSTGAYVFYDNHTIGTVFQLGMPSNMYGNQEPHGGLNYGGVIREYYSSGVQTGCKRGGKIIFHLNEPIYKGYNYTLKFFSSHMDNSDVNAKLEVSLNNDQTVFDFSISDKTNWREKTVTFTANNNYDRLVFEVVNSMIFTNNVTGVYIDDVSLDMTCRIEQPCNALSELMAPSFSGNPINQTTAFKIDDLENVEALSFVVRDMFSQPVYSNSVSCINGIDEGIYWHGVSSSNSPVANAVYTYEVTTTNFCGSHTSAGTIVKNASFTETTPFFTCDLMEFQAPKLCCEHEPVMYVDDHHWIDQEFTLHASSELIVASNEPVIVGSGSNVIMRAGERIELNAGFSSDNAEYFLAEIVPCGYVPPPPPAQRLAQEETGEDNIQVEENLQKEIDDKLFAVYPNPNSGSFTIAANEIATVRISDVSGKKIQTINGGFRSKVEVNGLSSGLYIIRVQMADGSVENAKVVVN